ncbi:MAG: hypothetical protein WD712_01765 [Candidatus Spechtbacterales bacterium]
MPFEYCAPPGKTRVIAIDPFDRADYLVGDYDDAKEAFLITDRHNVRRATPIDVVYRTYDDAGLIIRDNSVVGTGVGVIPY